MMDFISDTSLLLALGLLSLSALFLGVFVGAGVMYISFTVCGSFDPTVGHLSFKMAHIPGQLGREGRGRMDCPDGVGFGIPSGLQSWRSEKRWTCRCLGNKRHVKAFFSKKIEPPAECFNVRGGFFSFPGLLFILFLNFSRKSFTIQRR